MLSRRLNILNWPIGTKLAVIIVITVLVPLVIVSVPAVFQRIASLEQQDRVYLETLGPFEIARTEQALQSVVSRLNRFISAASDYSQIEEYLYKAPTALSETDRVQLQQIVDIRAVRFFNSAPSLSRVRFLGGRGNLLADRTTQTITLGTTPADTLIQAGTIGFRSTISSIYPDAEGNPSLDVIFTFRPAWATTGGGTIIGHVVFTHNLLLAPGDSTLPDLYAVLQDFPQSPQQPYVFLLDAQGRLISPAPGFALFQSAAESDGFQAASRGETGVSSYSSPFLNTEVLGYHTRVTLTDGPQIVVLAEIPRSEITQAALAQVLPTLVAFAGGGLLLGLVAVLVGTLVIARPLARLTESAQHVTAGRLDTQIPALSRRDEVGILNNTLGDMAGQLLQAINELEMRVEERTRHLETTLEIGRILTSIRHLDPLLDEVVNLILARFEQVYHAQVFLIDPRTNQARLRASTGVVGRQLLQRGHFLDVGSQSVIGTVTATGRPVVALDTSDNPVHRRNEFLPDTRSEIALPLRIGNRIIGALDLQSAEPDAFDERDVDLFQGMADQITIAIDNAMLFAESAGRLRDIETLNRLLSRAAWQDVLQGREHQHWSATAGRIPADSTGWTPLQQAAMQTGEIADQVEGETVTFAVPIILRGEVLGAVEWQVPRGRYTANARQTALELTTALALTADYVRLFEQSQRTAQREQLVNRISSQLTGTTDIDQILQTAIRELGLALRLPQTAIRLIPPGDVTDE